MKNEKPNTEPRFLDVAKVERLLGATCDPDLVCPTCDVALVPEHAHMKCPKCHYRDSCCF
jgi:Zn finger protein HypA/HybF involved in hydrogenase expression